MISQDMRLKVKRGETFSIDFSLVGNDGVAPLILLRNIRPYMKISIKSNLYERTGQYKKTYWIDLGHYYIFDENGNVVEKALPLFAGTETIKVPLSNDKFDTTTIIDFFANQGVVSPVLTDFVFTGFKQDGTQIFAYLENDIWVPYNFRIVKEFSHEVTKEWIEHTYFYDIQIVTGTEVTEHIYNLCLQHLKPNLTISDIPFDPEDQLTWLKAFLSTKELIELRKIWDSKIPLMPGLKSVMIILEPTEIKVGGIL